MEGLNKFKSTVKRFKRRDGTRICCQPEVHTVNMTRSSKKANRKSGNDAVTAPESRRRNNIRVNTSGFSSFITTEH